MVDVGYHATEVLILDSGTPRMYRTVLAGTSRLADAVGTLLQKPVAEAQGIVESEPDLKDGNVLVVDVGGGSTELLLVQKGQVTFSDSYRLGSLLNGVHDDFALAVTYFTTNVPPPPTTNTSRAYTPSGTTNTPLSRYTGFGASGYPNIVGMNTRL